ncbi:MAG: alanine--tRNA ligase [Candidatus Dormibacteria bacterium]
MHSAEIRQSFLDFFSRRNHQVVPSASLVPHGDPTLLFVSAGMVPFKTYYSGAASPPWPRAVSAQKCFRTSDLEEVGDDTHLTMFEMLGNFSFGDYFKEGAIEFAWEFLTGQLAMDPARIAPAVYPGDDDASRAWQRVAGKAAYPLEDNYWPENLEGWVGPNGPDSHIFWDWGVEFGCGRPDCYPDHCARWVEIWNLVFPQFDKQPDGSQRDLDPPGIDTGMGLERMASVLEGVHSVHQTDTFLTLNEHFQERSTKGDDDGDRQAYARRLLSDHGRATAFLIADGVRPGNEGRGFVLRKMVRRATLHGVRRLGISDGLSGAVDTVAALMGDAYPQLRERREEVRAVLTSEEAAFMRTLEQGEGHFEDVVRRSGHLVSGADAFKLHDTFGFPIELTAELAAERGLKVDRQGFDEALASARRLSRRGAKRNAIPRTGVPASVFTGHEALVGEGTILRLFVGDDEVEEARAGDEVELYLDSTPMYAESGGQVGDSGSIEGPLGIIEVRDVQRQGDAHAHYGRMAEGTVRVGEKVRVEVDAQARWATMRHHSATHLVHRALREVLGEGATQAGSYVAPDSTTFDFVLDRAVSPEELGTVFATVNRFVREDVARETRVMPLEEARRTGAMQLFGEKYGEVVRVVSFGDWSVELCGGTHVERSGQVGHVVAVREGSVGTGVRRVEFLAGDAAERYLSGIVTAAEGAAAALRVGINELPGRVEGLVDERRKLQRQVEELQRRLVQGGGGGAAAHSFRNGVVYQVVAADDPELVRHAADGLLDREPTAQLAVTMAGTEAGGRLVIKARSGGRVAASEAFARVQQSVGGRGGGNQTLAQGGGIGTGQIEAVVGVVAGLLLEHGAELDPGPGAAP